MNNGKICVSVCAETADEFIENIKRAEEFADVIELRFDCLESNQIDIVFSNLRHWRLPDKVPLIVTLRTKEQGGKRELTIEQRDYFWNGGNEIGWADLEEDVVDDSFSWLWKKRIGSHHDLKGVPDNLENIYKRLKATEVNIVKTAVQTDDIADSIAVWKLLERAKKDNKPIIPIAMGEAGKWTRILGLAHGAFMTYAALDAGKETASGQITACDLIETYRVKELDEQTEIYGIVGNPVSHSLSPFMQNAAFKFHKFNAVYIPFEVKNLDEFIAKFIREETREIELNFKGFSVTIPHKQAITKYLDSIEETARKIGAVNTVKIVDGKLHGYNTDAQGFIEPLLNFYGDLRDARVAILGSGGAARAVAYALKKENAEVTICARNIEKAKILAEEFDISFAEFNSHISNFKSFDIVVNATPLGMKGASENETPVLARQIENVKLVYDLIYNPSETGLIKEARKANLPTLGGIEMLVAQAKLQFEIWTGKDAPVEKMNAAALEKLK